MSMKAALLVGLVLLSGELSPACLCPALFCTPCDRFQTLFVASTS